MLLPSCSPSALAFSLSAMLSDSRRFDLDLSALSLSVMYNEAPSCSEAVFLGRGDGRQELPPRTGRPGQKVRTATGGCLSCPRAEEVPACRMSTPTRTRTIPRGLAG